MLRIGVVEDDPRDREALVAQLRRYADENDLELSLRVFPDGEDLVTGYTADYDLILMDIEMRFMDGMTTAEELRRHDEHVILIFVTNMPQYAISGYRVGASDFLIKPIGYPALCESLQRVLKRVARETGRSITVSVRGGKKRLELGSIQYVEVRDHDLIYHTTQGEFTAKGTIRDVEGRLTGPGFYRCNRCYIVGLKHVRNYVDGAITVGTDTIQVSRSHRREFLDALNNYMNGESS